MNPLLLQVRPLPPPHCRLGLRCSVSRPARARCRQAVPRHHRRRPVREARDGVVGDSGGCREDEAGGGHRGSRADEQEGSVCCDRTRNFRCVCPSASSSSSWTGLTLLLLFTMFRWWSCHWSVGRSSRTRHRCSPRRSPHHGRHHRNGWFPRRSRRSGRHHDGRSCCWVDYCYSVDEAEDAGRQDL